MVEHKRILVVDDDSKSRQAVANFLSIALRYDVIQAENGRIAFDLYDKTPFEIVITDIKMPECNGIELLKKIKSTSTGKKCAVVLMTGFADIETAVEALRLGAYDYIHKPVEAVTLSAIITRLNEENSKYLSETTSAPHKYSENIKDQVGKSGFQISIPDYGKIGIFSAQMRSVLDIAQKFHSDRSIPVLIEGETGTGKEAIARIVHHGTENNKSPFISINCSAIAEGLFESELFGYEAGAFTGASKSGNIGKLELSQDGTLFLDEIGELPLKLQPKLLRVLEEREMYRIGGKKTISLNIRIIAATNRNLADMVAEGNFRADLFHRLNRGKIYIPPLRERKDEIIQLSLMLLDKYSEEKNKSFRFISPEAREILKKHDWTGNIRELVNTIERVVLLNDSHTLNASHISFIGSYKSGNDYEANEAIKLGRIKLPENSLNLKALEDEIIRKALKKFNGNQSRTAEYLGIARTTLRSKIKNN